MGQLPPKTRSPRAVECAQQLWNQWAEAWWCDEFTPQLCPVLARLHHHVVPGKAKFLWLPNVEATSQPVLSCQGDGAEDVHCHLFLGLVWPRRLRFSQNQLQTKIRRKERLEMMAWTSSHLMASQTITSSTQAKALVKIGSDSSTTSNSNATTIATVNISAGFLGGASSLSSAVPWFDMPLPQGILWDLCRVWNSPKLLQHAQSDAQWLRNSTTATIVNPVLHVIDGILHGLGKKITPMHFQPFLKWFPDLVPGLQCVGPPRSKNMDPSRVGIIQSLNERHHRKLCTDHHLSQQQWLLLSLRLKLLDRTSGASSLYFFCLRFEYISKMQWTLVFVQRRPAHAKPDFKWLSGPRNGTWKRTCGISCLCSLAPMRRLQCSTTQATFTNPSLLRAYSATPWYVLIQVPNVIDTISKRWRSKKAFNTSPFHIFP